MNPSTIERIIYLSYKKGFDSREIAYVLSEPLRLVNLVIKNEAEAVAQMEFYRESVGDWEAEAPPPSSPILGKAV